MAPIQTQTLHALSTFAKRDTSNHYSLYVLAIMAGCIVFCLIGFSVYGMYSGLKLEEPAFEVPYEQRKYMREVHQRNVNSMAIVAKRPDLIVPVEELNY
ncbi:uncharacterized protein N7484_002399 [Penicillium longicatenatum]|uniref:uncharacterized protein n=1 Tax=Penicillium longicatenatum TaxID=1561947 RepID=UPI0025486455|nr:uncharacterized protein N7484_002399 [Penicillium longicatenatum]KAJ5658750.1 hypothetical protein N7484_002399 [Penicillium longicatenatum]